MARKLIHLRQLEIAKPCPEKWDQMEGDEARRFCAGCGCHVHNIAELRATEAEKLLAKPGRVCTRILSDPVRGILTKDGWVAKMLVTGAAAAALTGCAPELSSRVLDMNPVAHMNESTGTVAPVPQESMGDVSSTPPTELTGMRANPIGTLSPTNRQPVDAPPYNDAQVTMGAPMVPAKPPQPPKQTRAKHKAKHHK